MLIFVLTRAGSQLTGDVTDDDDDDVIMIISVVTTVHVMTLHCHLDAFIVKARVFHLRRSLQSHTSWMKHDQ